jgi:hypothetical protein
MGKRAVLFLVLALILYFAPEIVLAVFPTLSEVPWVFSLPAMFFLQITQFDLLFPVITALIFVLYPTVSSRLLSLVVLTPMLILAVVEWVVWVGLFLIICLAELLGPAVLFIGVGYLIAGTLGASIGVILLVTSLLLFGSQLLRMVSQTAAKGAEWGGKIKDWYFPWPGKIMAKVWQWAARFGMAMGGDITHVGPVPLRLSGGIGALIGFILTLVVWWSHRSSSMQTSAFVLAILVSVTFLSILPKLSQILAPSSRPSNSVGLRSQSRIGTSDDTCPKGDYHDWDYIEIPSNGNRYRTCEQCGAHDTWIGSNWYRRS